MLRDRASTALAAYLMFSTALARVPGAALPDEPPLGPFASEILLELNRRGYDASLAADLRTMLASCESEINATPLIVPTAKQVFVSTYAYLLQTIAGELWQARNGEPAWFRNTVFRVEATPRGAGRPLHEPTELCFVRRAQALLQGQQTALAVAPVQPAPVARQLTDQQRLTAVNAWRADYKAFRDKHPTYKAWSALENNQWNVFAGTRAMELVQKRRAEMGKEEFDLLYNSAVGLRNAGLAACPNCKAEYPAGEPGASEPSSKMKSNYENAATQFEVELLQRQVDQNADKVDGARQRTIHNRANDATGCIRVEPTGVKMEWGTEGRYRMRNNCSYPIAASWCSNANECSQNRGNLWTIAPGTTWPIFFADPSAPNIQIGACKAGDAKQPPLGHQPVERLGFNEAREQPVPTLGVSLIPSHICK